MGIKTKKMKLNNLNLVELNAQEVSLVNGGNGIHSGGYGIAADQTAVGSFVIGFFAGLFGY